MLADHMTCGEKWLGHRTYPENTDIIEGAIRWPIGLDHAEHTMQLPASEENDKQMVGVPKPLKVGAATLLDGIPDHDAKCNGHDPAGGARAGGKVCGEEGDDLFA